ncbi:MAG: response regulator [Hyphomicrobium sp.]
MMHSPAPSGRIRVLIADDDPIFVSTAEACLAQSGYCVHTVRDGGDALQALNCGTYDVAIIDLSMPRIDGFRLIALIRSTPHLEHLPIVVMSVRSDAAAVEEAFRLGANAFETKPVNWNLFPAQMRQVVRCRTAYAALKAQVKKYAKPVIQRRM